MHGPQLIGTRWTHRKTQGDYIVIGDICTPTGMPWKDDALALFAVILNNRGKEVIPLLRPMEVPFGPMPYSEVLFTAFVRVQFEKEITIPFHGLVWVLYQSLTDMAIYARQKDEFLDGRFVEALTMTKQ